MELFYLSNGCYFGDPVAEISEYKDGYLLKVYVPEEPCICFDYIPKESGDELIKFKDNPDKAFDGCGADDVFNHNYTDLKEYDGYDEMIQAILNDSEARDFMEKVNSKIDIRESFAEYMYKQLFEAEILYIDGGFLDDETLSLYDLCNTYMTECNK